jgi:glycosyltransferase involved in cell wall biosynthesis
LVCKTDNLGTINIHKEKIKNYMKILFYSDSKVLGGAENYLFELASRLNKDIFQPFLICSKSSEQKVWREKFKEANIPVFPFATQSKIKFWKLIKLVRLLKKIKPDVFVINFWSPYCATYGMWAAKLAGIKRIIGIEHMAIPLESVWHPYREIKFFYLRMKEKIVNKLVAVSVNQKEIMMRSQKFPSEKIEVVNNGVDEAIFRLASKEEKEQLRKKFNIGKKNLVVGSTLRLVPKKGLEQLLEAFAEVAKHHKEVCLRLANEGPFLAHLVKKASELGISEKVSFLGKVKVPEFLKTLDVFVCPSLEENFPLSTLEAGACGLPIIASSLPGIIEQFEGVALFFPPGDKEELRNCLEKVLSSKKLRENFGGKARKRVLQNFTIAKMVAKTERIFLGKGNEND